VAALPAEIRQAASPAAAADRHVLRSDGIVDQSAELHAAQASSWLNRHAKFASSRTEEILHRALVADSRSKKQH
jgi:hypothetical protein